ncbi:MAG: single-stranded-DNA-specific exonuclease [Chlamydiales bacterium]|jgi:single-stranded-DNA-specific exonuclease
MQSSEDDKDNTLWIYPESKKDWSDQIIKEFRIHPVTAQVLVSRGFTSLEEINRFLYAKLPDLHDPSLFPQMEKAVHRVCKALQDDEGILIYGDNDVDGMTGTALLTDLLSSLGAKVFYYVPNRASLRRSLILDALDYALENSCKLLITVDCGITAVEGIKQVVQNNVDVIITDHHEPTDQIPHCVATLNPKLVGANYPNRELTGVGVAFKLAHGLTNELIRSGKISNTDVDLKSYLDLVALGTISDMGALLDENRILVRYGLNQISITNRIGLAKLFSICGLSQHDVTVSDIASKIAPRLNSLGRIADPRKGVELLLIKDSAKAEELAKELDLNNIARQKIERAVSSDVDGLLISNPEILDERAIILSSTDWHPGVIPIVATRLSKHYNRPTVIIAIEDGVGKGSMRSIREFPLLNVLKKNSDLLLNYGGHDYAAGMTIVSENIELFKKHFIEEANLVLQENDVLSKLTIDAKVDFDEINFDFMESLHLLAPFGNENPAPILYCDVQQTWPPKIIGTNHLKLYMEQHDRMLEGICFGMANRRKQIRKKNLLMRIAFTPQINTFQNKTSIQLLVRDFSPL